MISKVSYTNSVANQKIKKSKNQNNNISFQAKKVADPKQINDSGFLKLRSWWKSLPQKARICIIAAGVAIATSGGAHAIHNAINKADNDRAETEVVDNTQYFTLSSDMTSVPEKSIIVQEGQTVWSIAEDELTKTRGEGNFSDIDILNRANLYSKLNNLPLDKNGEPQVNAGDKFILQEEGKCGEIKLGMTPYGGFMNKKGEAWGYVKGCGDDATEWFYINDIKHDGKSDTTYVGKLGIDRDGRKIPVQELFKQLPKKK